MSDDASKLSELTAYLDEGNKTRLIGANKLRFNKNMGIGFAENGANDEDLEYYAASDMAMRELVKLLGMPYTFMKKSPTELAVYNLRYLARISTINIVVTLSKNELDPTYQTITEVRQDTELGVRDVVRSIAQAFTDEKIDPHIIQADIIAKSVSMVALLPETARTGLGGDLQPGVAITVPTGKKVTPHVVPVLGDLYSEEIIAFNDIVSPPQMYDLGSMEQTRDTISSLISSAIKATRLIEDYMNVRADKRIQDMKHIAYTVGERCGVTKPTMKKVFQALIDMESNAPVHDEDPYSVFSVARAVMSVEGVVKGANQALSLGTLAGSVFVEDDPDYCPTCHQELDENGGHLPKAEL